MAKGQEQAIKEYNARVKELNSEYHTLFAKISALTLEIGCGHGHFLTQYAQEHSEKTCVGIDLLTKRIERSEKKKTKQALDKVHFLKVEANQFIEALPSSISLESVFLLFPDPWPKNRHHKNRLIQPEFLSKLAKRCPSNTPFYFRTDHKEYFDWVKAHLEKHEDWNITTSLPWPLEVSTIFQEKSEHYQSLIAQRS